MRIRRVSHCVSSKERPSGLRAGAANAAQSGCDRRPKPPHQALIIRQIVRRQQHWPEHFPGAKQMMQIGARVALASRAGAGRIQWTRIIGKRALRILRHAAAV